MCVPFYSSEELIKGSEKRSEKNQKNPRFAVRMYSPDIGKVAQFQYVCGVDGTCYDQSGASKTAKINVETYVYPAPDLTDTSFNANFLYPAHSVTARAGL